MSTVTVPAAITEQQGAEAIPSDQVASITVYAKPMCIQCDATKRKLTKAGTPFTAVDITADPDAYELVTTVLRHASAPIVVARDEDGEVVAHFSQFRPELLKALANRATAAA